MPIIPPSLSIIIRCWNYIPPHCSGSVEGRAGYLHVPGDILLLPAPYFLFQADSPASTYIFSIYKTYIKTLEWANINFMYWSGRLHTAGGNSRHQKYKKCAQTSEVLQFDIWSWWWYIWFAYILAFYEKLDLVHSVYISSDTVDMMQYYIGHSC